MIGRCIDCEKDVKLVRGKDYCRHCSSLRAQRKYREKNREDLRAQAREYVAQHRAERDAYYRGYLKHNRARRLQTTYDYYERNREKIAVVGRQWKQAHPERDREYRMRFPQKYRARTAVGNAIASGKLVRQPCEVCGDFPTHAHHDDYELMLDVRWLCPRCHGIEHREAA